MEEGKINKIIWWFRKSAIWILPIIFAITAFFGIVLVLIMNGFNAKKNLRFTSGYYNDDYTVTVKVKEDSTYDMSDLEFYCTFVFEDGSNKTGILKTDKLPTTLAFAKEQFNMQIYFAHCEIKSVKVHNGGHIAGASILLIIAALSLGGEIFIIVKRAVNKKRRIRQIMQNNENQLN